MATFSKRFLTCWNKLMPDKDAPQQNLTFARMPDKTPLRFELAWPGVKIAIEPDRDLVADRKKRNAAERFGWLVLVYGRQELSNPTDLVHIAAEAIERRRAMAEKLKIMQELAKPTKRQRKPKDEEPDTGPKVTAGERLSKCQKAMYAVIASKDGGASRRELVDTGLANIRRTLNSLISRGFVAVEVTPGGRRWKTTERVPVEFQFEKLPQN